MSSLQPLRPYQSTAVSNVIKQWRNGSRSVLLVAPTGAGKTRMGEELVHRNPQTTLWIAHRRELINQAAERLRASLGRLAVGCIAPGHDYEPHARVQVATVQTLLARGQRPDAKLIIWDEAHHYIADDWSRLTDHYADTWNLGLTATPERQDGRPLGDMFDSLAVAASYSELVRSGHLVSCRVYQPPSEMGSDIALDPLEAYRRHAQDSQAFLFGASVSHAQELCERFNDAGIPAGIVHGKLCRDEREQELYRFRRGRTRVLCNFNVLTEGVDIPAARTVIMCRGFKHVGSYLQAAGRVLRPHPDKPDAIIIDLTGATLKHGFPTDDREYSLDGQGIKPSNVQPLRQCLKCGGTLPAHVKVCTECGYVFPKQDPRIPRIYSLDLREVYAGAETPEDAKTNEYKRLRELQRDRGWSLYYVQKQYQKLFKELPIIYDASPEEKRTELERLTELAAERGYKPTFAGVRFKATFGHWPKTSAPAMTGTHPEA